MTPYKVLFLDVDGTVLTHDNKILPSTKAAIQAAQEKGIHVFLATGRPAHELDTILDELGIIDVIGYNGAYARTGKNIIYKKTMDPKLIEQFLTVASTQDHELLLYNEQANLFTSFEPDYVQAFIKHFGIKKNEYYRPEFINDVLGITVMHATETEIKNYNTPDDVFFSPVNVPGLMTNFDIIQGAVNKGTAVQAVLNYFNLDASEAIAFGDGMNDREMLTLVGEGFAMGNAHHDLLPYANQTTTAVDDDGIYNGLKKINVL
ncbi:hypothetical protein DES38_102286 [Streptohalobacillus salinus]|uniref:Cof subfamily protein (Haloacid dehalogenase superfamily)/HAD superfamily hydrolase (TIGR01484 family) n=1 Tax=Streptohalobacillus salinus TaxID=621096 RepID=A0A2V3WUQ1_9BACI|nr:HAD family hydrolase [Streptohalobacillus salinus]PXW92702.1 hypothetical protein DES38_102286 [Streptohalobacillus salinus]